MKSAVETLDPTRVRLNVEVPFEELKPSLDAAYRRIAQQVSVPGFRRGKVPPPVIDRRIGRGAVLEEAVNDALPRLYSQAVEENSLQVVGQPEVDVTEFADGADLHFSAEVEVRPEVTLPEDLTVEVVVDEAVVTDEEVDEQLRALQERFGTLTGVDRPAAEGDFVQLDLRAEIDGQEVDSATGTSYQIGSGTMIEGLDEAVIGHSVGDTVTFRTQLAGGEHEGETAEVTVTIRGVKERHLPQLDDEFAQLASEFDTLEELRADLRTREEQVHKRAQAFQARDKILEALLDKFDLPVPAGLLAEEIRWRQEGMRDQLEQAGLSLEEWLESQGQTVEGWEAEIEDAARSSIKAQFVLDALASREQLSVTQQDLTEHIIDAAGHVGMTPDQFAQQALQAGQVPSLVAEVLRGKALALVVESAHVTDTAGHEIDLTEIFGPGPTAAAQAAAAAGAQAAQEGEQEAVPAEDAGPVEPGEQAQEAELVDQAQQAGPES